MNDYELTAINSNVDTTLLISMLWEICVAASFVALFLFVGYFLVVLFFTESDKKKCPTAKQSNTKTQPEMLDES